MKELKLTNSDLIVLVDDEDYPLLSRLPLRLTNQGYVYATHNGTFLHKIICPCAKGLHIHHINGNKLDNRKENLQVLTPQEHRAVHAKYTYKDCYIPSEQELRDFAVHLNSKYS